MMVKLSLTQKPEIIHFYKSTKGSVDGADKLKKEFTVASVPCRWPLTTLALMNNGAIKSCIICKVNFS